MSNYPPGVTGNEYEIAGPDYEKESDIPCPKCKQKFSTKESQRQHELKNINQIKFVTKNEKENILLRYNYFFLTICLYKIYFWFEIFVNLNI